MSARSRERWKRLAVLGRLRLAEAILDDASDSPHFSFLLRVRLSEVSAKIAAVRYLAQEATTEPAELSAKKGS